MTNNTLDELREAFHEWWEANGNNLLKKYTPRGAAFESALFGHKAALESLNSDDMVERIAEIIHKTDWADCRLHHRSGVDWKKYSRKTAKAVIAEITKEG